MDQDQEDQVWDDRMAREEWAWGVQEWVEDIGDHPHLHQEEAVVDAA